MISWSVGMMISDVSGQVTTGHVAGGGMVGCWHGGQVCVVGLSVGMVISGVSGHTGHVVATGTGIAVNSNVSILSGCIID